MDVSQPFASGKGEIFESGSMRQQNVFGTVRDLLGDAGKAAARRRVRWPGPAFGDGLSPTSAGPRQAKWHFPKKGLRGIEWAILELDA
jgi:hypothetical protein